MELQTVTNLMENEGSDVSDLKIYKTPVKRSDKFTYRYIMERTPDDLASVLDGDYLWSVWNDQKYDLKDLKEELSQFEVFVGDPELKEINILKEEYWSSIGYKLIKNSIIGRAFISGPFFFNKGKLYYAKPVDSNKGRKVYAGLDMTVLRSQDGGFFVSFDMVSKVEKEDNPPESWKDDSNFVTIKPESGERVRRLREILKNFTEGGEIEVTMNNSTLVFTEPISFPKEVDTV